MKASPLSILFSCLTFLLACLTPARAQLQELRQSQPFASAIGGSTSGFSVGIGLSHSGLLSGPATVDYKIVHSQSLPENPVLKTGTLNLHAGYNEMTDIGVWIDYASIPQTAGRAGYIVVELIPTAATGINVWPSYGYIVNIREFAPTLSVSGGSVIEGNTGTAMLPFTITLDKAFPGPFTFEYKGDGGTATADGDYSTLTQTGTIPAGQLSTTVYLPVNGDTAVEENETVGLALSVFSLYTMEGTSAPGTILTDDFPAGPAPSPVMVTELPGPGGGQPSGQQAWFAVDLPAARTQAVDCRISTRNGTALVGTDYRGLGPVRVTFAPGEVRKWVSVGLIFSPEVEPSEQFFLDVEALDSHEVKSAACTIEPLTTVLERVAPGVFRIRFPAGNGQRYVVEESTTLTTWTENSGLFTGAGNVISHLIAGDAGSRYFRVKLLALPPPGTPAVLS